MNSFLKTVQTNAVVQSILFIVLGLVLLLIPGITLVTVVYLIGTIFAVSGVLSLVAYFREKSANYRMSGALATGILLLLIALFMFIFPAAVAGFFAIILGLVLMLCGVFNVVRATPLRMVAPGFWITNVLVGILVAIGGVVIIWNPFETTELMVQVLGVLLIVSGISDLVCERSVRKHKDEWH